MTQYLITLEDESKARSLIQYLKSLDFISLKQQRSLSQKRKGGEFSTFLRGLPEVEYNEVDVVEAIKKSRNESK